MSNNISDVTVNISVEDVVNPATFGGLCLYVKTETNIDLPYTEVYSTKEAEEKIKGTELVTGDQNILSNAVNIAFMQKNSPEKIGLLACPIDKVADYYNCEWRYLIPLKLDADVVKTLSASIESADALKVLCLQLSGQTESGMDYGDFESDVYNAVKDYERTCAFVGVYAKDDTNTYDKNQIATALFAETASKNVGSFTYKNQSLKGVYADESITKTQLNEYHSKNVNAYVHKAGYDVTSEGKLLNGEYIDILDAKDWIITQIKYKLQQALIVNDKIPYDNNGIALLESIVVNVLQDAYNNGMIAEDDDGQPLYSVEFAKRSETKASDREKRQYVEGKFSFDLAGAIHEATVNGTINI